jgi:hypothetical protein
MSPHTIIDLELIVLIMSYLMQFKMTAILVMQFSAAGYCIVFLRVQMLTWAPCSYTPWHYSSHRLNPRVSLSCRPKNAKIYDFCVLLDRKFGLTSSRNSQNRICLLLTEFTNMSLILRLLLRRIWRRETYYARRFGGTCCAGCVLKIEPAGSCLEVNNLHINGRENVKSSTVLF